MTSSIIHQDATRHWPVNNIDLIVTSPPYALDMAYTDGDVPEYEWEFFMRDWLARAYIAGKDGTRLALNIPLDTTKGGFRPTYPQAVTAARGAGWQYRSSIVWEDGQISKSVARGSIDSHSAPHIIARVEMVVLFYRGDWGLKKKRTDSDLTHQEWLDWTSGLWRIPAETRGWEKHPAAFPEELPRRLIKLLSGPGALVVDPFCGSGTTALAAAKLLRRFVGFDISPEYVASAQRRVKTWEAA